MAVYYLTQHKRIRNKIKMKATMSNFAGTNSIFNKQINMISNNRNKVERIKVVQKCKNCLKHIEQTAMLADGVIQAKWDTISDMLVVEYNSAKTSLKIIELAIADAGHDTLNFKGRNNYYGLMPQCCQYSEQ